MSNVSIAEVVLGGAECAEQPVAGSGMAWFRYGPRPRTDALLTLDPTQRPSAPLRWGS